jgi:hypothetical protein
LARSFPNFIDQRIQVGDRPVVFVLGARRNKWHQRHPVFGSPIYRAR